MNDESRGSTATAVGGGSLAGFVVCVGCLLPMWLTGVGRGAGELVPSWTVIMPALWAAASAGGGSFCFGSTLWTALRAAILGLFAWPLAVLGLSIIVAVILSAVGSRDLGPWQYLILFACVAVPGGAYLGAVLARRELLTIGQTAGDEEASQELDREGESFDWGKISTRSGAVGLLLVFAAFTIRESPPMGLGGIFVLLPGLLLSAVAIVVGLWTRAGRGWILGLVAWLAFLAVGYLRAR